MSSQSNSIQIFQHQQFGEIRSIVYDDGNPWFVARDVAEALGYKDAINAIKQHCKGVVKHHPYKQRVSGSQAINIIPEADVYRLIMRSKLPQAEAFQDWVVEEILPSIRKKGYYGAPQVEDAIQAATKDAIRDYHSLSEELRMQGTDISAFINKHRTVLSVLVSEGHNEQPTVKPAPTVSADVTASYGQIDLTDVEYNQIPGSAFPAPVYKKMVKILGTNEAVVLGQLQRMIATGKNNSIKVTYATWLEKYPYKSKETLRKTVRGLEDKGIIKSEKLFVDFVRSKEYRIDYEALANRIGMPVNGGDL